MRRLIKQLFYAAILFGVLGAIGYSWLIRTYRPSCFDNLQNQGEVGIDCGGPCQSCEIKTLGSPVVTKLVWFPGPDRATVDVAVEIKNTNLAWGALSFPYRVIVLDSAGGLVTKLEKTGYLLPGEARWILETAVPAIGGAGSVKFEFDRERISWKKFRPFSQETRIAARNVNFRRIVAPEIGFAELSGEVVNQSIYGHEEVVVQGFVYDLFGTILAVGRTTLHSVVPGEARFFSIKWNDAFPGNPARWDVVPTVNVMAHPVILERFGE